MFEHSSLPLLPRKRYLKRLALSFAAGSAFILTSLLGGMAGYHYLEHMSWLDAYVNAAMILSGMGPLSQPQTGAGKLFAGSYALYSGLVVIVATGIIFAPVLHRLLHRFHLEKAHRPHSAEPRRSVTSTTLPPPEHPAPPDTARE